MSSSRNAVILGGGSLVADYLLPRLASRCDTIQVVSRQQLRPPSGVILVAKDKFDAGLWECPARCAVIALLPIPALIPLLPKFVAAGCIVALSSTRRFGHANSTDPDERAGAEALAIAEDALAQWCRERNVGFTVLRPTMIYDMKRDLNLARMAAFIRRFRLLPIAWPAKGLRQPIHADDVAKAVIGSLDSPAAEGRTFDIAGAERLTYRRMSERVFESLGLKPRFIMLPIGGIDVVFRLAGWAGLVKRSGGAAVFRRMNEDLVADIADGRRVLGYQPRGFDLA